MSGFFSYIAGGALKGAGDAMVDKAKVDREAAIAALQEQNKRTDAATEEGYQQQNIGLQSTNAKDLESMREKNQGDLTDKEIAARHADVSTEQAGQTSRSNAEISGRHADVAAQGQTQLGVAKMRLQGMDDRSNVYAQRYANSNGGVLTPGQALLAARSAYADAYKNGEDLGGMTAQQFISAETDRLLGQYGRQSAVPTVRGSVSAPGGGDSAPDYSNFGSTYSLGGVQTQAAIPQASSAPSASPAVPPGPSGPAPAAPPQAAVDMLRTNPNLADAFDQKYGQGAAAAALKGTPQQ